MPLPRLTFDLQGRLVGAPHMDEGPRFQKADYPLKSVALGVWDGHLFREPGRKSRALEHQLGLLIEKFRPWGMADLRRAERIVYDVAANWKLILQNFSECLHCPSSIPRSRSCRTT